MFEPEKKDKRSLRFVSIRLMAAQGQGSRTVLTFQDRPSMSDSSAMMSSYMGQPMIMEERVYRLEAPMMDDEPLYPTWFRVIVGIIMIFIIIAVIVGICWLCRRGDRRCRTCHTSPCCCSGGSRPPCPPGPSPPAPGPCPPTPCPEPLPCPPGFVVQATVAVTDAYFLPIEPNQGVPVNPWQTYCATHQPGCAYVIQVSADNRTNKTTPVNVADLTGHFLQYNCETNVWLDLGEIS